jgi:hypothetical protein
MKPHSFFLYLLFVLSLFRSERRDILRQSGGDERTSLAFHTERKKERERERERETDRERKSGNFSFLQIR